MDGPIDWWWKMNLLDVCVQAGFCQIRSHIVSLKICGLKIFQYMVFYAPDENNKGSTVHNLHSFHGFCIYVRITHESPADLFYGNYNLKSITVIYCS